MDGFFGYSLQAPFDRIILTAAVEEIPKFTYKTTEGWRYYDYSRWPVEPETITFESG